VTAKDDAPLPLLVDSSRAFPLFLEDSAWKKAGVDVRTLDPVPDAPTVKHGAVPMFRMGGFDLAKMPAIAGGDFSDLANAVDVDLAGVVGADLLAFFRITFADEGRFVWLEPDPTLLGPSSPQGPGSLPGSAPPIGPPVSQNPPALAPPARAP